jgi:hypothetical protein
VGDQLHAKNFIAELPVEALDQRVLRGLAALDEAQRHLVLTGEFRLARRLNT